jgi:hypothetical protein
MATATAPRNDVYLSLLAGHAVTSLIDLASDPPTWNGRVEGGLRDGIRYCQAVRARGDTSLGSSSEAWSPLKRSVEKPDAGPTPASACAESERVEQFLSLVAARKHKPDIPELVSAIEFLRKTATDR